MSDMQYFYADGNQQRGPHSAAEIIALHLAPATLVWRDGMANWQRLDSVPELNPTAEPAPVPPADAPPRVPPPVSPPYAQRIDYGYAAPRDDSKKILAGIMGILFGGFGVHKFVLGYNQAGVIMLVTTLASGFVGCCFAPLILVPFGMGVIGLVEGIIYLAKSNDEFYQTYILNQREWF